MTDDIIAALKTVYDPEIPADIYELGLIYKIDIADDRAVTVDMTLTTPNCPSAQELPIMVENAVASVPGRRRGQGQHRVGSALGPEPDVGRSARRAQHVVRREARPRDRDHRSMSMISTVRRSFYERGAGAAGADQRHSAFAPTTSAGKACCCCFAAAPRSRPCACPGGTIPPHDGHGPLHIAFAIAADALPEWEQRLWPTQGIAIEGRTDWSRGGAQRLFPRSRRASARSWRRRDCGRSTESQLHLEFDE